MLKNSMIKKIVAFGVAGALAISALGLVGCGGGGAKSSSSASSNSASAAPSSEASVDGTHHAKLVVEGYEPITIELDADAAPITVTNFKKLVEDGYYDGLTFYRVQDGFCLQGGTEGNTASGKDPNIGTIVGEFSTNGYDNPLADKFGYGTVAMARTNLPDSASSTFFVTLGESSSVGASLNGNYAAFGTIDPAGMQVIEQIVADSLPGTANDTSGMGMITDESAQPKIKSITWVD